MSDHGYETSEEIKEADLVILNTCHIRDEEPEKMYSDLEELKNLWKQ